LAVVSLGAAAIHFAVLGHHLREYVPFGVFFAVVAWAQAAWAVGVVARPGRRLLQAGIVGNSVVVAVWVVSRTWSVPLGPGAGRPEAVAAADVAATILEAVLVIGAAGLLLAEARGEARGGTGAALGGTRSAALAGGLSLLAVSLTTVGLSASDGHEAASAEHGGQHVVSGEHGGHQVMTAAGEPDPQQIAAIRDAMDRYSDVEVARDEGWEQEHADEPGTGAHFARPFDEDEDEWLPPRPDLDLLHPDYLMYSKIGRDGWELVAVAYVIDQTLSPDPPTDLRGAAYHEHVWTCLVDGEELDEDEFGPISRDECRAREGEWSPGGVWMTHVWMIDNPSGPFAETNPDLV
jgi:hypothetical protein